MASDSLAETANLQPGKTKENDPPKAQPGHGRSEVSSAKRATPTAQRARPRTGGPSSARSMASNKGVKRGAVGTRDKSHTDQYVKKPERRPHPLLDRDSPYKIKRNGELVLKHDGTPAQAGHAASPMKLSPLQSKRKATPKLPSRSKRVQESEISVTTAPSSRRDASSRKNLRAEPLASPEPEPTLAAAMDALGRVSRQDMTELKHIRNPSPTLKLVVEAVLAITGIEPPLEWRAIKAAISRPAFVEQLQAVQNPSDLSMTTRETLRDYLELDDFTYEHASRNSTVCAAFFLLVRACAADKHSTIDDGDEDSEEHASTDETFVAKKPSTADLAREQRLARRRDAPVAVRAGDSRRNDSQESDPNSDCDVDDDADVDVDDDDELDVDDEEAAPIPTSVDVELVQGPGEKLGFSLREGRASDDQSVHVFISKVTPNLVADRSGRIKVGQRLLQVNGHEIVDYGPKKSKIAAVDLIKAGRPPGTPLIVTVASDTSLPSPRASEVDQTQSGDTIMPLVPPPPTVEDGVSVNQAVKRPPAETTGPIDAAEAPLESESVLDNASDGDAVGNEGEAAVESNTPALQPPQSAAEIARAKRMKQKQMRVAEATADSEEPQTAHNKENARLQAEVAALREKLAAETNAERTKLAEERQRLEKAAAAAAEAAANEARLAEERAQQAQLDKLAAENAALKAVSDMNAQKAEEAQRMIALEAEVSRLKLEREQFEKLSQKSRIAEAEMAARTAQQAAVEQAERDRLASLKREAEAAALKQQQEKEQFEKQQEEARLAQLAKEEELHALEAETKRLAEERAEQAAQKAKLAEEAAALEAERDRKARELESAAAAAAEQQKERDRLAVEAAALVKENEERARIAKETAAQAEALRIQKEEQDRLRAETEALKKEMEEQKKAAVAQAAAAEKVQREKEAEMKAKIEAEVKAKLEAEIRAKAEADALRAKSDAEATERREAEAKKEAERQERMEKARELVTVKEAEARRSAERLSVERLSTDRISMGGVSADLACAVSTDVASTDGDSSPPPVPPGSPPHESPEKAAVQAPISRFSATTPSTITAPTTATTASPTEIPEWKKKLDSVRQLREQRQQRDAARRDIVSTEPRRASSSSEALAKARERVAAARQRAAESQRAEIRSESAPVSTTNVERTQALRLAKAKAEANWKRSSGGAPGTAPLVNAGRLAAGGGDDFYSDESD